MKITAEQVEIIRHALDYTGRFTNTGAGIPKTHDKRGEEMYTSIYKVINTEIEKELEKKKKAKDTSDILALEVTFTLEQRVFLLEMLSIPWEARFFEKKNTLISLLNT